MSNVRWGKIEHKGKAIKLLESALKNSPELENEALPYKITDLEKEFDIFIDETSEVFEVSLGPRSGEGHDYMFCINKKTDQIEDLAIGEVIHPPRE